MAASVDNEGPGYRALRNRLRRQADGARQLRSAVVDLLGAGPIDAVAASYSEVMAGAGGDTSSGGSEDNAASGAGGDTSSGGSEDEAASGAGVAVDFAVVQDPGSVAELLGIELVPAGGVRVDCPACCDETYVEDLPSACEGLSCDERQSCAMCPECQMHAWKVKLHEPDPKVPARIARAITVMRPTQLLSGSVCVDPACVHPNVHAAESDVPRAHGRGLVNIDTVRAVLRRAQNSEDNRVSLGFVTSLLEWNLVHLQLNRERRLLLSATSRDSGLSLAGGSIVSFSRVQSMLRVTDLDGVVHPVRELAWKPATYGVMCAYCRRRVQKGDEARHQGCNVMAYAQSRFIPLRIAMDRLKKYHDVPSVPATALLWACVFFAQGPEAGDDVIQCPCCGLQRCCEEECTHYTCPACRTRVCRQCHGIHQVGPSSDPVKLSSAMGRLMQSCGVPFAASRSLEAPCTWFDHNFVIRQDGRIRRHGEVAGGMLYHCFLYESQAEEIDQRVEGEGLRDIERSLRLSSLWGPRMDCH